LKDIIASNITYTALSFDKFNGLSISKENNPNAIKVSGTLGNGITINNSQNLTLKDGINIDGNISSFAFTISNAQTINLDDITINGGGLANGGLQITNSTVITFDANGDGLTTKIAISGVKGNFKNDTW